MILGSKLKFSFGRAIRLIRLNVVGTIAVQELMVDSDAVDPIHLGELGNKILVDRDVNCNCICLSLTLYDMRSEINVYHLL